MALIEKEFVPPRREQINIRLNPDVLEMLGQYCRFIESSLNHIVEQSLRFTFNKDRAFQEWLLHNASTRGEPQQNPLEEDNSGRH